ncbi:head maturation protease, ClpP-related [Psychrilyobacter atlanticus]|uniref:head maturation protease, ClpP-related n=1 Tax=Psychrilyobacter atlanticus TaxID=271091 RepID=UPI0003F9C996|nr:head maturation protease, ClpP-related [Psychrilyobacter atlanticus]
MSLLNAVMMSKTKAEIRMYGVIGEGWMADVTPEDINRELDALGDITEIDVRINSRGGGVFAGCAIYNSLKRSKAKVNMFIDGICASIATVVVMAGDTIHMSKVSMMMIHNPYYGWTSGEARELRKQADELDQFRETSIEAYLTKVNIPRETLIEKMDETTWMTAKEALKDGFITDIENDSKAQMSFQNNMLMCGDEEINVSDFKNLDSFLNRENLKNSMKKKLEPKNKNLKNTQGVEKMDLNQLMQEHPDLYKQIVQVGVNQERERIQNLETIEQRAGRSLECVQKAKFETPLEATNQELMTDVLQEMATQPKNTEKQPNAQNKMEILLNKIDDAKAGGVQDQVLDGMTQEEIKEKQEKDEIDDIVALANGEE